MGKNKGGLKANYTLEDDPDTTAFMKAALAGKVEVVKFFARYEESNGGKTDVDRVTELVEKTLEEKSEHPPKGLLAVKHYLDGLKAAASTPRQNDVKVPAGLGQAVLGVGSATPGQSIGSITGLLAPSLSGHRAK